MNLLANKGQQTDFVSQDRSSASEIKNQAEYFVEDGIFSSFLNTVPTFLLVLNENRQIVYSNDAVKKLFPGDPFENIYGKRPGELLDCSNFTDTISSCGTSKFCSKCGALKSILSGLSGVENNEECRISQAPDGTALDLRVWSKPIRINDKNYVIFAFTDISDEKRREALERIFFHDVINTADSILKLSELLKDANDEKFFMYNETIFSLTNRLIDEIKSQRDLLSAENNELIVNPVTCNSLEIISDVIVLYSNHQVIKEKEIIIDQNSENINFISDNVLLKRVLGNMIKNALEASNEGDKVTAGSRFNENEIEFYIHNNIFMPDEVQLQIFQRSFSTKGTGRGLGTYSIKLLSEKYLRGKVLFESSEGNGTTFYARFPLQI
jgi:nitrogen fixation/metabolism regulation signal transduction histidine kinase